MKKKITFNDIAKKTNFSKTTISRYFNNPDSLTEESKKKIENALVELDYKENKVARSLANGKTEMIGIIIPDLFLHYYSQILDSLINTYPKYKYKFLVFVGNNNRDEEMNYINELLAYQIEGLIILSHSIDSKTLSELNIPIVSIEREDKYISSVNSDNYYGSLQATNLLINNNCDMLIHINGGVKEDTPSYKRIEAFKTACETNNINYKCYLSKIGSTFDTAYHNIYNIYEDIEKKYPNGKKGIFLSNDTHANILLNILIKNKYQNGELKSEDYELAKEEMLKFNNNFNEPLRGHIIESATRVVNYRQYLYKNETLIDFLELDYELCDRLGLQSIYKTKTQEEWNKDYYKRNSENRKEAEKKKYQEKLRADGKVSKKQEIEKRRKKIKALLEQDFKRKDICSQLDISIKTYKRDISFLKEQGLI